MKILFISNLYPPNVVGGYERLCFDVASAFVAMGHEATVLTSAYGGRTADYPGQKIFRTLRLLANEDNIYQPFSASGKERATINAGNVKALRDVIAAESPDTIFVWNLFFFDRSLLSALDDAGRPVILMLTDNWLISALNGGYVGDFFRRHVFGDEPFATARPSLLDRLLRRRGAARFPMKQTVIFGADFMRALHHAAGFSFVRETVIHNGVRLPDRPDAALVNRAVLRDPRELRLLFAGRIVDVKGAHTALEALPLLQNLGADLPPARLTIVGDAQDSAYRARLDGLLGRMGGRVRVDFAPPAPENALFDLFQQHDVYLFPSLYEPFSLTLIHALAAGIPTVASDIGGNTEIIADGETGLLFRKGDPADLARAVAALARSADLRVAVSAQGRRAARALTFERMVQAMAREHENAVNPGACRQGMIRGDQDCCPTGKP